MSLSSPRIIVMPLRQAWPWRWELALLEFGCCQSWRLPNAETLAVRAGQIGQSLLSDAAQAALGFAGYTLIGACWRPRSTGPCATTGAVAAFGPFVMSRQTNTGLDLRLLEALASLPSVDRL